MPSLLTGALFGDPYANPPDILPSDLGPFVFDASTHKACHPPFPGVIHNLIAPPRPPSWEGKAPTMASPPTKKVTWPTEPAQYVLSPEQPEATDTPPNAFTLSPLSNAKPKPII